MQPQSSPPRRFAIGVHPESTTADTVARQIKRSLLEQGATEAFLAPLNNQDLRQRVSGAEFDALIAVGGDGTMLRAGHLCAPQGIPIMGINVGHFGFSSKCSITNGKANFSICWKANTASKTA